MNRNSLFAMGIGVLLCVFGIAIADETLEAKGGSSAGATVADIAWLAGQWKGTIDGGTWESSYTTAEGGIMLSASKEFRGDRVVTIEFECFRVIEGKLTLIPYPFGKQSETVFPIKEIDKDARKVVFANPEHDFPRELTYHRSADDRLQIKLTGEQRGKAIEINLDLRKSNGKG
jgi:hypothetical protein